MKSLYAIGAIALMFSSILSANEAESKDCAALSSETLNLAELLSYVEDTVGQLLNADEENGQAAYHELSEGLKIVYAINCLYPEEAGTILQTLDECYVALADALDRDPGNSNILDSLMLFPSGRNYEHETFAVQSIQELANTEHSNELTSTLAAADANFVYIQDNVLWDSQENTSMVATRAPTRLFYNEYPSQRFSPKVLIIKIKSNDSPDYEFKAGASVKLGGKDHGKVSTYVEGEIKDKNGNYAKAKVSKEKGDDGYDCDVETGKKKK